MCVFVSCSDTIADGGNSEGITFQCFIFFFLYKNVRHIEMVECGCVCLLFRYRP